MDDTTESAKPVSARLHGLVAVVQHLGLPRWSLQATALSYYSILGVVPFLALCFSIAKSFGLEEALSIALNDFFTNFDGQEEILLRLRDFADNLIANYSGSIMAFSALLLIFWSGFHLLQLVESALGVVFGYRPDRRTTHRFLDYFAAMVLIPMVVVMTGAINVYLTGLANRNWSLPFGFDTSGLVTGLIVVSPYVMWWMVLTGAYIYFSRGLAARRECLLGGFLTSLAFQIFQGLYITIMLSISSYNAIYGSFAAIPLFMIWLYSSWLIVLGGGELTRRLSDWFTARIPLLQPLPTPTWRETVDLAQAVMAEVGRNFTAGPDGGATSFRELATATRAPMPRLGAVVTSLIAVELLVPVAAASGGHQPSFLPTRNPEGLSEAFVLDKLENGRVIV
ncbi:MAG: YihY/virulence factor BrkB family protein [Planctomycetaceae bacterium]|nr:YihY/virulence factor BrkB family protein [Planctomycetaceae bacterium]